MGPSMAPSHKNTAKSLEEKGKVPNRGRPPVIDSARLLAVAREVFLERGIRATTLEVAERAGVSEGVLFHRFKSKEGLFSAAMNFDHEAAPRMLLDALGEVEDLEVREGHQAVDGAARDRSGRAADHDDDVVESGTM